MSEQASRPEQGEMAGRENPSGRSEMAGRENPSGQGKLAGRLALGLLLGIGVYGALALWADAGAMAEALRDFDLVWIPAACGLSFVNYVVRFPRWERYRGLLGIRMDRWTSFLIYLAGLSLTVTPGKMGEAFKSWLIRRVDGTPLHKSAPIVLAERLTDLFGFLALIAVGGLATQPQHAWLFWVTAGLCAALVLLVSQPRWTAALCRAVEGLPAIGAVAARVQEAFDSARVLLAPKELILPTILATLGWGLECVGFWLIANALIGPEVTGSIPLLFAVYAFALSAVAGAVMILAPGGLGVTEATLGGLLTKRYEALGVAAAAARPMAVSATLIIRLCTLWFAVVVGLVALALFRRRYPSRPAEAAP